MKETEIIFLILTKPFGNSCRRMKHTLHIVTLALLTTGSYAVTASAMPLLHCENCDCGPELKHESDDVIGQGPISIPETVPGGTGLIATAEFTPQDGHTTGMVKGRCTDLPNCNTCVEKQCLFRINVEVCVSVWPNGHNPDTSDVKWQFGGVIGDLEDNGGLPACSTKEFNLDIACGTYTVRKG